MGSWKDLVGPHWQRTKKTAVINEDPMPSSICRLSRCAVSFGRSNDYVPQIASMHPCAFGGSSFGIK
jgi:hypothetical protein